MERHCSPEGNWAHGWRGLYIVLEVVFGPCMYNSLVVPPFYGGNALAFTSCARTTYPYAKFVCVQKRIPLDFAFVLAIDCGVCVSVLFLCVCV